MWSAGISLKTSRRTESAFTSAAVLQSTEDLRTRAILCNTPCVKGAEPAFTSAKGLQAVEDLRTRVM